MKEIIVLLRPNKAKATKQKLAEAGFLAYTESRVFGRGKQRGVKYALDESASSIGIPFLPKKMLQLVVSSESVDRVVQVLMETNRTGEMGDGKIFVCPIGDSVRIRTDERGKEALV